MADWAFRCYLVRHGLDVLDEWRQLYDGDDKLLAKLDTRLRFLQQQSREFWRRPYFDTLSDDCSGLGEVRFEYRNIQHRILGFASGQMEYTFLMAAVERGDKFEPHDTCDIAQRRKRAALADRSLAVDCDTD